MNRSARPLRITALAAAMLLSVGCVTTEGPSRAENVSPVDVQLNSVAILSDSLNQSSTSFLGTTSKGKIEVDRSQLTATATGLPEVVVMVRNRTDYPLQVEGRTTWFDQAGVPVDGPSAWQRIMLPPNGVTSYREKTVSSQATQYYVEMREGS